MKRFSVPVVLLFLIPATLIAQIFFVKHTLSGSFTGACSVHSADIDGDSLNDVVGAAWDLNRISWWENQGGTPPTFLERTIGTSLNGVSFECPADVDGDGDIDVLACAWYGGEVAYFENLGGDPIDWTMHTIDDAFPQAHEVNAADIDKDGDMDAIGASAGLNQVAVWEQIDADSVAWEKHVIGTGFAGARSARALDANGDSLLDVVGAALTSSDITLWLNQGDWTFDEQVICGNFSGAHMVHACDLDRDGDDDVLGVGYMVSMVTWWRNDGGDPIDWTRQNIDSYLGSALGVHAADMDGDEDIDVLGTAEGTDDVMWYQNLGGDPIDWDEDGIDLNFNGAWPVYADDLDGDGDNDVMSCASYGHEIAWWENRPEAVNERGALDPVSRRVFPTVLGGPLELKGHMDLRILDVCGRPVDACRLGRGVFFLELDGEIRTKILRVR
jgi:hypothetical protein